VSGRDDRPEGVADTTRTDDRDYGREHEEKETDVHNGGRSANEWV